MYIYFNKEGVMATIISHNHDEVIRQGSTFDLCILFDQGNQFIRDQQAVVTVQFRRKGEKTFGNEFFMKKEMNYKFQKKEPNEMIFELKDNTWYTMYYVNNISTYYTEKDGDLEALITVYDPLEQIDVNADGTIENWEKAAVNIRTAGLVHLYVERTIGSNSTSQNTITPTQYQYLMATNGNIYNLIVDANLDDWAETLEEYERKYENYVNSANEMLTQYFNEYVSTYGANVNSIEFNTITNILNR